MTKDYVFKLDKNDIKLVTLHTLRDNNEVKITYEKMLEDLTGRMGNIRSISISNYLYFDNSKEKGKKIQKMELISIILKDCTYYLEVKKEHA